MNNDRNDEKHQQSFRTTHQSQQPGMTVTSSQNDLRRTQAASLRRWRGLHSKGPESEGDVPSRPVNLTDLLAIGPSGIEPQQKVIAGGIT